MGRIRGIVFDFGGVISAPELPAFYKQVEALAGWSQQQLLDGWARHRAGLDTDRISVIELYRLIAADLQTPLPEDICRELGRLDYEAWSPPNPGTFLWAQELKAAGYRIGILTNMPTAFIPWFDRCAAPFRALADAEVISGAEGIAKPDPAIYALMAERMGLTPAELFFLDDSEQNIAAAVACGWRAHRFTTVDAARSALETAE